MIQEFDALYQYQNVDAVLQRILPDGSVYTHYVAVRSGCMFECEDYPPCPAIPFVPERFEGEWSVLSIGEEYI